MTIRRTSGAVDHIRGRKRHRLPHLNGFGLGQAEVERIRNFAGTDSTTVAAERARFRDVPRADPHYRFVVPRRAIQPFQLRQGQNPDPAMPTQTLEINFQAAGGRAHFGKVLMERRHPPAQEGRFLEQDNLASRFGRFNRGCYSRDSAADHQDRFTASVT